MADRNYPGLYEDDLLSLDALAARGLPFAEAIDGWDHPLPLDVAEKAYNSFLRFHGKPIGRP